MTERDQLQLDQAARGGEPVAMTEIFYMIEHQLAEGTWVQLSGPIYSDSDARTSIAYTRERHPNTSFRLIQRTIINQVLAP